MDPTGVDEETLYAAEIAFLVLGSIAVIGGGLSTFARLPPSQTDPVGFVGEGAIAVAFLVVILSVYRFREALDVTVYHPFMTGFVLLYLSASLDFVDEFVAVTEPVTYTVENAGGVLGAISVAIAFGYWVNQYEQRGQMLTEREERLQHRTEQLEILNQIVRHDIRNDLNVIDGRIQLAIERADDEGREHLQIAHRSAVDAITLTETARDFVDAITEPADRALEPIPVVDVLTTQIEQMRESHPDAEFRLERSPERDVQVLADEMISSLFRNLLRNAVQHNDKEPPRIIVSVLDRDETVLVRVADNGPGIADGAKEGVFDRGLSGPASDSTGIGLYVVEQLVSQYGGAVWIEDNEPEGTVFNVRLRAFQ